MSMGSLLSMRPSYLLGHHFYLSGNNRFQPSLVAPPHAAANTETITWANAQCKVDKDNTNTIQTRPDGQKAYGFLPWRPGGVTYMEIDPNAQLVLTGPLSACTVWAFQDGAGTTVLCHANANTGQEWGDMSAVQRAANLATKLNAINTIKGWYNNVVDLGRLVYANTAGAPGATTYQGYMGFVLGCKPRCGISFNKVSWSASRGSNTWTFYFYGFNGANANDRVLWPI